MITPEQRDQSLSLKRNIGHQTPEVTLKMCAQNDTLPPPIQASIRWSAQIMQTDTTYIIIIRRKLHWNMCDAVSDEDSIDIGMLSSEPRVLGQDHV